MVARDGVSYVAWFAKEVGNWESVRKERGRLGSVASACSLDGGDSGRLGKLGACECVGLLAVVYEGVCPEKEE